MFLFVITQIRLMPINHEKMGSGHAYLSLKNFGDSMPTQFDTGINMGWVIPGYTSTCECVCVHLCLLQSLWFN